MMKRTLTAAITAACMVCTMGLCAYAADETAQPEVTSQQISAPALTDSALYYGQVKEIIKDEAGTIKSLYLESEFFGEYLMHISPDTVWVDSGNHCASDPSTLQQDERVYVARSHIATFSIPPQSPAFAVIRNIPQDAASASYHVISSLTKQENGELALTVDGGGLIITVPADAKLYAYQSEQTVTAAQLHAGARVMAWYDIVATSYPAQTTANAVMLLPALTAPKPAEGAALKIALKGEETALAGVYENSTAMLPVAAVAKALGYQVTYTQNADGQLVTVESDTFSIELHITQQLIFGVTKNEGASGLTGPQNFGAPAYIKAPGTTWAPAETLRLLGHTVTLVGDTIQIQ